MNYTFQSGGLWFYFSLRILIHNTEAGFYFLARMNWILLLSKGGMYSAFQQGRDEFYFLAKNKLIIISENEMDFPVIMGVFYFSLRIGLVSTSEREWNEFYFSVRM